MLGRFLSAIAAKPQVTTFQHRTFKMALEILSQSKFDEARKFVDRLQNDLRESQQSEDKKLAAALLIIKGIAAYVENDFDTAEENAELAIKLDPFLEEAYELQRLIYFIRSDYPAMLNLTQQAINRGLRSPYWIGARAIGCFKLADTGEALRSAQQVLESYPSHRNMRYILVKSYIQLGDYASAESELSKCSTEIDADSRFIVIRGKIKLKAGNYDEALTHAEAATKKQSMQLPKVSKPFFQRLKELKINYEVLEIFPHVVMNFDVYFEAWILKIKALSGLRRFREVVASETAILSTLNKYLELINNFLGIVQDIFPAINVEVNHSEVKFRAEAQALMIKTLLAQAYFHLNNLKKAKGYLEPVILESKEKFLSYELAMGLMGKIRLIEEDITGATRIKIKLGTLSQVSPAYKSLVTEIGKFKRQHAERVPAEKRERDDLPVETDRRVKPRKF